MAGPAIIERRGPPLTLRYRPLGGEEAEVDALAFADFLVESIRALRQTAELLADRRVRARYSVSDLHKNSPALVELTPRVPIADVSLIEKTQHEHVQTVAALQEGRVPAYLDYGALQTYRRLGEIAKRNNFVAEVQANGASAIAGAGLKDRLDLELQKDQWAYGTARGWIRSYHAARGRRLIRLYPRVGPPLVCQFRPSQQAKVLGLIEHFAEAEGRMRYRPGAYHPYFMEIADISGIDLGNVPTFAEMDGFAPGLGEGTPSEELVREMRDEW